MHYVRINSHLQVTRNALIRNDLIRKQRNQGLTGCRKTLRHPGESRGPVEWAQYNQRLLDPGLRRDDDFSENFTFFDTLLKKPLSN